MNACEENDGAFETRFNKEGNGIQIDGQATPNVDGNTCHKNKSYGILIIAGSHPVWDITNATLMFPEAPGTSGLDHGRERVGFLGIKRRVLRRARAEVERADTAAEPPGENHD